MNVYIAAPWVHRDDAREAAKIIDAAGHIVTEAWWDHVDVGQKFDGSDETAITDELARQAALDIIGVMNADVVVVLNLAKSEGKAVEQGIALTLGVPIIGVGQMGSNVFQYLPQYTWVDDVVAALGVIDELESSSYSTDRS